MNEASLIVNGRAQKGWTQISVSRSLENIASAFDVAFIDRWSANDLPVPIRTGDKCLVRLDDNDVLTGFANVSERHYNATTHSMRVAGRSLGDLVDCSAKYKKGTWKKQGLLQIANDICTPFKVDVSALSDLGKVFETHAIQDGETAFDCLERACRMRGVIMQANAQGGLDFVKVGAFSTAYVIEYGKNVVEGGSIEDDHERFSEYTFKTQSPGNDDSFGVTVAHPKLVLNDAGVSRYRPLIVQLDSQSTTAGLKERGHWELNVRAGRSQRVTYTVKDWYSDPGFLWRPNMLVQVRDPMLEVDAELLTVSTRQIKSASGTFTELELCDPAAMQPEPVKPKKGKKANAFFEAFKNRGAA